MEEIILRFPHIGERTFKKLSNKNLAKCKNVSRTLYHFITNEKFYKLRVHYENLQKEVDYFGETPLHKIANTIIQIQTRTFLIIEFIGSGCENLLTGKKVGLGKAILAASTQMAVAT